MGFITKGAILKSIHVWQLLTMMSIALVAVACSAPAQHIDASPTMAPATAENTLTPIPLTSTAVATVPAPMAEATATESSGQPGIQPVDANQDGKIDAEDVLLLMEMADKHWDEMIIPLLRKAGIETDKDGKIISKNPTQMIKEKLTASEQMDLDDALKKYELFSIQVDATLLEAYQNR